MSRAGWIGVAAVGLAAAVLMLVAGRSSPAAPRALPTATSPAPTPATAVAASLAVTPTTEVPPGVTAERWARLQSEMRGRPDGAAELRRLADYFSWSDTSRRFRAARGTAEAAALAPVVDAGLADRVSQREVSAGEALLIKAAVLEATVADPAERAVALQRWQAAGALAEAPAPDRRQAEFQRRQAELVAAWSARPVAERDQAALTRDLEALRRASFAQPVR